MFFCWNVCEVYKFMKFAGICWNDFVLFFWSGNNKIEI